VVSGNFGGICKFLFLLFLFKDNFVIFINVIALSIFFSDN